MSKNQVTFFATAKDIAFVLSQLEMSNPLQYASAGLFRSERPQIYSTHQEIPDIGIAVHPTAVANPRFLVSARGAPVHLRQVPQVDGGMRFAVDQRANPDSVILQPGGRYGADVILYGMLGTVSQSAASMVLYELGRNALNQSFARQDDVLLGPDAKALWNAGVRLTIGVSSPTEFDLKRTC